MKKKKKHNIYKIGPQRIGKHRKISRNIKMDFILKWCSSLIFLSSRDKNERKLIKAPLTTNINTTTHNLRFL